MKGLSRGWLHRGRVFPGLAMVGRVVGMVRDSCPLSVCVAWLPHCIQQCGWAHLWGGSWLWGHGVSFSCCCLRLLPLLCVVVVIVRRSWPFVGQLLSFVVAVVQLLSFGSWDCLQCGGCMTWHGDSVLRWWWLRVEE